MRYVALLILIAVIAFCAIVASMPSRAFALELSPSGCITKTIFGQPLARPICEFPTMQAYGGENQNSGPQWAPPDEGGPPVVVPDPGAPNHPPIACLGCDPNDITSTVYPPGTIFGNTRGYELGIETYSQIPQTIGGKLYFVTIYGPMDETTDHDFYAVPL